ncbi:hypothetical protein LOC54_08540 [Acetobacter sp. AN02]|uniref:hypothetical protein n=1 Tax=Acetobacter sp. AN02 TaxID=2894186 RepID=UPI0024341AFA|nr:hypothetical protein [Acetobacter sp. AN02]MDG6095151.1 hypothetical protein [Acetobacter sp. AN02]
MKRDNTREPFFTTEEIRAEMVATGYEFKPSRIACTGRLPGVLERMGDAELALQSGEIADQERMHRQNKPFSAG